LIYCIDFDGTIVEHEYPKIGAPVPHAIECLKALTDSGCYIILWTMRSGEFLNDAVEYLEKHEIPLWGINKNPEQDWSTSPKAYAQRYIDDAAMGCPLVYPPIVTDSCETTPIRRPYVDWPALFPELCNVTYVDEIIGTNAYIDGELQPKMEGMTYKTVCCHKHATVWETFSRMIVCADCGDKRCPKALDCQEGRCMNE